MNTLKFGNGEWYGKKDTILAYNDENSNFKPLPFSFDRDTIATRVNKEGLIETVGSGEPRIDYKDDSKGALLLEPSRTNLITYSEDLTNTAWDNVAYPVTITSNSIISPDGSLNGTLITPSSGNSRHAIRNLSASAVSGTTYMLSVFVKKGGSRYIVFGDAGDNLWRVVTFDLDNGVVTNEYNSDGTITSYGNGWYRITCKITRTNAGTIQFSLGASETNSNSGLPSFDNTSLTVYAYGCQIESNSSYATSYIPTQGSIGTRDRELSDTQNLSHVIGQTEGVIFYDAILIHKSTSTSEDLFELSIDDGSNQNIFFINNYNNSLTVAMVNGGSPQFRDNSFNPTEGARYKLAFAYKQNDFALYINGNQIATSSSGTVPTMNQITFGNYYNNSYNLSNSVKVNEFKFYNTRLSNAELQALTQI